MFEVLSHQTHQRKLEKGNFLSFCVYLDYMYKRSFPNWQRRTHILRQRRKMHPNQSWEEHGEAEANMMDV